MNEILLDLQFLLQLCNLFNLFGDVHRLNELMDRILHAWCYNDNTRRDEATLLYLQNWNPLTRFCQLLKAWLVGWTSNQLIVSLPVVKTPLCSSQLKTRLIIKPIIYLFLFSHYPCVCPDFYIYLSIDNEIS